MASRKLNTMMKWRLPYVIACLLFAGGLLRAGEVTVNFDFGTDPGKVAASAGGFALSLTGSGGFSDRGDGLEASVDTSSGFQNFAFLRSFSGLGGGLAGDFTISTEIRVNNLTGSAHENNDRCGILLFGASGNDTADSNGISAQVLAKANTTTGESQPAQILLRDGVNGATLNSATWTGGPIVQNDALRLVVVGTYLDATEISLAFTLSRLDGSNTQTITTTVSGAKLSGTRFGGALRIKNGRAIEFDSYSVTVDTGESGLPLVPEKLVAQGAEGLIYSPYANEGQTEVVHTVPDYSRAGYQGGGVAIPFVPAVVVLEPQVGDDRTRIQDAIQTVAAMPLGPDGFRGAILLKAGDYHVSSTLSINTSGIVIRGEGSQLNGGTRIIHTETTQSNLFHFHGSSNPALVSGSTRTIADALVPVGSRTLNVTDASGFTPGDLVRVSNTVNQKWIDDIRMTSSFVNPAWEPSGFQLRFYRYVTAVNGNELTLDAPIVQAIETQYGGGTVERFTFNGAIRNVGIEAIRLESTFTRDTDEQHGWVAVEMRRVVNGWARQVTSRYFGMGFVLIDDFSQFVTVEDSACLDPKSITTGGRKYSFHVDDSSYVLMQRNLTRGGRHDYVTSSLTPGPNVFVDSLATQAADDSGPHFRYATGELYDNIKTDDKIRVQNRADSGTSHGWAGAQVMFWNVEASGGIVCDAPTGAMNWAVGAVGAKQEGAWVASDPFGIWESHNTPVEPRSLYYAQLKDRLGSASVRRVILPHQQAGTIWNELLAWGGEGLFGAPLIASLDTDEAVHPGVAVPLTGRVRDLQLMESLAAVQWSVVSGPGPVFFDDATMLETTATFPATGSYLIEFSASDQDTTQTARLLVQVLTADGDDNAPAAPEFFTPTYSGGAVLLQWRAGPEADVISYNLYRSLVPNDSGLPLITALTEINFTDADVVEGNRYYYAVTSVDADGNESPRSVEWFITALGSNDEPSLNIGAIDSAWVRAGQGVQDASQSLLIKRADFTGTARVVFLRFPLSAPSTLGGTHADDIESASLAVFVTGNQPADTLRVYALLDGTQASPSSLGESNWSGGSNGTAAGGNNLEASNRPDGASSLPNSFTTVELGSLTFAGVVGDPLDNDTGLHLIPISALETLKDLLRNDSNGQITLLIRGQRDNEFSTIASVFNTQGNLVPTLTLTVAASEPNLDSDGDGVPDFFETLYGSDPTVAADSGFRFSAEPSEGGDGIGFRWEVQEQFVLGTHYNVRISTNLTRWDPLPEEHYTLQVTPVGGRTRHKLTLTQDYGDRVFLRLVNP